MRRNNIASVSAEYSRLEVLGMNGMITIGLVVVEKCKVEIAQFPLCGQLTETVRSLTRPDLYT